MRKLNFKQKLATTSIVGITTVLLLSNVGLVAAAATTQSANSTSSTATANNQATRLANIKAKGAAEITRRLDSLNAAVTKINGLARITASDKAYLLSEINNEISGLTALQSKLAADTTLSQAITDAQSIYTEYRVYALVLPKAWLVATADSQLVTEGNLTTLAQKLQSRINNDSTAGKNVAQLQTELNDMTTQTNNAQSISSGIEQKVLTLQPSD